MLMTPAVVICMLLLCSFGPSATALGLHGTRSCIRRRRLSHGHCWACMHKSKPGCSVCHSIPIGALSVVAPTPVGGELGMAAARSLRRRC
ncbi:MAG: hypothetical protein AAGD10_10040 [Myxococcota bacterium]